MVCMDIADVFLCLSKAVNYFGRFQKICDGLFTVFFVVWIFTRHLYLCILIYSVGFHLPTYPIFGPGRLWVGYHYMYVTLLSILEVLCVYWFTLMLKIVAKVLQGENADDVRSDDEDEKQD